MYRLLICLFFVLIPQISFGEDGYWVNENGEQTFDAEAEESAEDSISDDLKRQAAEMEIIYESMNSCMPTKSKYMQIFGFEGNLCHFRYTDYDCFVPQDVAARYSELGLKIAEEMSKGNISTESSEAEKIQEILSNKTYCSNEMPWFIPAEDENGTDIPLE